MAQKDEGLFNTFPFTELGETELMRQLSKQKIQHYNAGDLTSMEGFACLYTGRRQVKETASEGIKQPQMVYVLTWL